MRSPILLAMPAIIQLLYGSTAWADIGTYDRAYYYGYHKTYASILRDKCHHDYKLGVHEGMIADMQEESSCATAVGTDCHQGYLDGSADAREKAKNENDLCPPRVS